MVNVFHIGTNLSYPYLPCPISLLSILSNTGGMDEKEKDTGEDEKNIYYHLPFIVYSEGYEGI